jgi:hypothetical protein
MTEGRISIWFFIGLILLVYGVLIFGTGIYDYYYPPEHQVVLSYLHAGIWWGALLVLIGGFYCHRFFPKRSGQSDVADTKRGKEQDIGAS